jgi:carbamoyl-phosphate synthase large subunit
MIHPDLSTLLMLAGASLAVYGLVWRRLRRSEEKRWVRRSLEIALNAPDPAVRSSAIAAAGTQGVSAYAELLLRCAARETDPGVIQTLATTVAHQQWEPMDSPAVVQLRLWAHRHRTEVAPANTEAEAGPAGEAEVTEPKEVEEPGPVAPVLRLVVGEARPLRSNAGLDAEAGPPTLPPQVSPPPVSPPRRPSPWASRSLPVPERADGGVRGETVLVTGAGGPAGVAVIRALDRHGVTVVGADADDLAVGLRLADEGAVIPMAGDPQFVDELVDLAKRTGAIALVCTVAEEMATLRRAESRLREVGLATWFPSDAALEASLDKWRFVQVMHEAGVRVPPTALGRVDRVPGPWIVKPRFGRGSRDVYTAEDSRDLAWALQRVDQPIVQTRVGGREFTVDALVDRTGRLMGAVPRWRLETKAGISTKGRTFTDEALVHHTAGVLGALGLTGPANVQGFMDEAGTITFIEVNPRFSGGLPLSIAAGADLVGEYLRGVLGLPIRPERLVYRPGMTMIRHFEEVFET